MEAEKLYNLGVEAFYNNDFDTAIDYFEQVLKLIPNYAYVYNLLGLSFYILADLEIAIKNFEKAIQLEPNNGEYYFNLAQTFQKKELFLLAKDNFEKAIELEPNNAQYYEDYGILLHENKDYEKAIAYYNKSLTINSNNSEIYYNLSLIALEVKDFEAGIVLINKALAIDSKNDKYYGHLALILIEEVKKINKIALNLIYSDYLKLKDKITNNITYGLLTIAEAIRLADNKADYYNLRGILFYYQRNFEKAIEAQNKAILLNPHKATYYANLASTLDELGELKEAEKLYQKAIELDSNNNELTRTYALFLLKTEVSKKAFQEYEKGRQLLNESISKSYNKPLWHNENLVNKKLFIYHEQGLGDVIQNIRYLKYLKELGAYIILFVNTELKSFLEDFETIDLLVSTEEEVKKLEFDYCTTLMSVMAKLELSETQKSFSSPYLKTKESYLIKWKEKLKVYNNLKVGFIWKSSFPHESHNKRSIDFSYFYNLAKDFPEITFFSLQKGTFSAEFNNKDNLTNLVSLSEEIKDFNETSGILENLDLLISIDSVVIHLAGALDKKAYLLLPIANDWRWGLNSSKTNWYPSITILRQEKVDSWDSVFIELKKLLI